MEIKPSTKNETYLDDPIRTARYTQYLSAFVAQTDEKEITANIISDFLEQIIEKVPKDKIEFLDIGCGSGEIPQSVISRLSRDTKILYYGIDNQEGNVKKANFNLESVAESTKVVTGDALNLTAKEIESFLSLNGKVDVLLISHFLYYTGRGQKHMDYLEKYCSLLGANSLGLLVHSDSESDMSSIREIINPNGILKRSQTREIEDSCRKLNLNLFNIPFSTSIKFPELTEDEWDSLIENVYDYDNPPNDNYKIVRNLLEFDIAPFENLTIEDRRKYITLVRERLQKQGNFLRRKVKLQILISREHELEFEKIIKNVVFAIKSKKNFFKKIYSSWLYSLESILEVDINDIIKNIWIKENKFIGYPEILELVIDNILNNFSQDISSKKKELFFNIIKEIQQFDENTLLSIEASKENFNLIRRYQKLQKTYKLLPNILVYRFFGDIMNMGGLNIAVTKPSEEINEHGISEEGYARADLIRRLMFLILQQEIKKINFINSSLSLEGGDEVGGFLITRSLTQTQINELIKGINDKISFILNYLGLGNIKHNKYPDNLEIMGSSLVCCACKIDDLEDLSIVQQQIERQIDIFKKEIGLNRSIKYNISRTSISTLEIDILDEKINFVFRENGINTSELFLNYAKKGFLDIDVSFLAFSEGLEITPWVITRAKADLIIANYQLNLKEQEIFNFLIEISSKDYISGIEKTENLLKAIIYKNKFLQDIKKTDNYYYLNQLKLLQEIFVLIQNDSFFISDEIEEFLNKLQSDIFIQKLLNCIDITKYKISFEEKLFFIDSLNRLAKIREHQNIKQLLLEKIVSGELEFFLKLNICKKNAFFVSFKQTNLTALNQIFQHNISNRIFEGLSNLVIESFRRDYENGLLKGYISFYNSSTGQYGTKNKIGIILEDTNEEELYDAIIRAHNSVIEKIKDLDLDKIISQDLKQIGIDFIFASKEIPIDEDFNARDFLIKVNNELVITQNKNLFYKRCTCIREFNRKYLRQDALFVEKVASFNFVSVRRNFPATCINFVDMIKRQSKEKQHDFRKIF
ncbi:MAG TPA: class I SAM-dependent methyltransferase [Rickettsiales bacterium]|nr:class I SAM-dependent methyltransferase [Rickettsiales bacterium]